ncbi:uncharacterized protein LOC124447024 [Xenia sp. Carnegie-2017]|uniref:uncharacterized protein LOC124447024 n=1 Tax=Xenia sp. Carnegie-2017 TaxID=2897299 RepID=UPI001F04CB6A|nr:uncharacterized protein LOC124447024 [Xenia sp. Carnegie-2017]
MKNSETHCVVLLVIVAHFLSSVYSSSTDTGNNGITIDCECKKTDCVNYYCNCQTYSNTTGEARERCFYDSSTNSCVKNETCDRIVTCDESCHKNATCKRNDSGHYACVCNDGFCGSGTHCQPICNRFSTVSSAECKCPCLKMVYFCNVSSTTDKKAHIKAKVNDDFVNCFCQIGAIKFSSRNYTANESDEMVMVKIEVDGCAVFQDIVVNVTTQDRSAKSEEDYILKTFSVKFTPNDSGPKIVNISLKQDNLLEMDEDFYVLLNVTDESVQKKTDAVKITIIDSSNIDANVSFEKSHYAFREGENVSVPITLYGNITFTVNVRIISSSETAVEKVDYEIKNQVITFHPENREQTILCNITINADDFVEKNETFFLKISSPTEILHFPEPRANITIINKNVATVKFKKSSYSFFENNNSVSMEIILHGKITFDITVNVTTQDHSAKSNEDYILNTSSVKFTPNDSGPKL